jgi:hypothetical protein
MKARGRERVSVIILKPMNVIAAVSIPRRGKRLNMVRPLIVRVLSSFPNRCQPVAPSIYRGILSLEYFKKTFHIELEDKCIADKPSCPSTKKRVEWLNMSGLERPRKAFSLARDDLEAAVVF